MAPLINQNAVYVDTHRQQNTIAIVVLVLNLMTPFSLGTFAYMCCYQPKDRRDTIQAICQIAFTGLAWVMFIVFATTISSSGVDDAITTVILFWLFMCIAYIWGIVFGGMLLCKVRSTAMIVRMPIVTTTNVQHANVQYQQIPQQNYQQPQYQVQPQQQYQMQQPPQPMYLPQQMPMMQGGQP